ncbi:MAG TPA: hypothetical protein VMM37_03100 [Bacteroidota bacterium]|nr:hypothetical protein [Bacteroidota bacterium]
MYERCLNEAERILATSGDIVLPIKHVWKQLADEGKRRSFDVPTLTDFDALLEGDKRFEIISAQTEPGDIESLLSEDGEEVDANLGTLGFYPEDRVKLRRLRLPSRASESRGPLRGGEEDEDVVPLTVKGLSATRPVRTVETKKGAAKKSSPAAPKGGKSHLKHPAKKQTKSRAKTRKPARGSRLKSRS